jgi:hypothetical protein
VGSLGADIIELICDQVRRANCGGNTYRQTDKTLYQCFPNNHSQHGSAGGSQNWEPLYRADPDVPILTTPGILRVLGFGKTPAPIDDPEINAIRTVVESKLVTAMDILADWRKRARYIWATQRITPLLRRPCVNKRRRVGIAWWMSRASSGNI